MQVSFGSFGTPTLLRRIQGVPVRTRRDDYLALVDWTGRQVRGDKAGAIRAEAPPILARVGLDEGQWHTEVLGIESRYWRAVGPTQALVRRAAELDRCWLKGVRLAPL